MYLDNQARQVGGEDEGVGEGGVEGVDVDVAGGGRGDGIAAVALLVMFAQAALSALGGSATEYLYKMTSLRKSDSKEQNTMLSNMYLYTFGVAIAAVPVALVPSVGLALLAHPVLVLLVAGFAATAGECAYSRQMMRA